MAREEGETIEFSISPAYSWLLETGSVNQVRVAYDGPKYIINMCGVVMKYELRHVDDAFSFTCKRNGCEGDEEE